MGQVVGHLTLEKSGNFEEVETASIPSLSTDRQVSATNSRLPDHDDRSSVSQMEAAMPNGASGSRRLGEMLVRNGFATEQQIGQALSLQQQANEPIRLGEILVDQQIVRPADLARVVDQQRFEVPVDRSRNSEVVRIKSGQLDRLRDAISDLVLVGAELARSLEICEAAAPDVHRPIEQLETVAKDLRELINEMSKGQWFG